MKPEKLLLCDHKTISVQVQKCGTHYKNKLSDCNKASICALLKGLGQGEISSPFKNTSLALVEPGSFDPNLEAEAVAGVALGRLTGAGTVQFGT